jgi:biopolymer transport protein ExbD
MDILMIIVVFLLKSYGLSSMSIVQPDRLELPISKASEAFAEGLVLVVAQDQIVVADEPVIQFVGDHTQKKFELPEGSIDSTGNQRGILPVYDVLARKKEEFDTLASRTPNPEEARKKWTGELLLQADKSVPYELLRQIMYTAGMAGYKTFKLTVQKLEAE